MKRKFKVGDLVYYLTSDKTKKYCIIASMTGNKIWGNWYSSINEAKNNVRQNGFMPKNEVYLVSKEEQKPEKPDNHERFMVYGTGCDNKSDLVRTEKELRELTRKKVSDSFWTGQIIGYKLVPLFEGVRETKLKVFKNTKLKKLK